MTTPSNTSGKTTAGGADTAAPGRARSRLYLVIIFALFIVPLVLAWALYGRWHPTGTVHHGELLSPVIPVNSFDAADGDGGPLDAGLFRQRWTLAYIAEGGCAEPCRDGLYKIRQIRLALGGKNIDRVQTVALFDARPDAALSGWLEREHAAMRVAVAPDAVLGQLRAPFSERDPHSVYLLDPLGNLVMRYDAAAEPQGVIADLKRLLKLSRIG